ncbi:MAG: phospholipid carrier-dependent glycosyltransferase [Patescibacteria group bacterium]
MKKKFKIDKILIVLFTLALFVRFFHFNYPPELVFDEIHFGKFIRAYFTNENYFDIHPPFGKLLIFEFAKILGLESAKDDFLSISQNYDPNILYKLRLLPAFTSVLFVLIIYLFSLRLTGSKTAATVSSLMVLFDNAITVHSRLILLDIFLVTFGFLSLYFYLLQRKTKNKRNRILLLILAGLFLGMAYSIKWTGLSIVFLIFVLAFYDLLKNKKIGEFFFKVFLIYLISFLFYLSIFAIHFAILSKSGSGDAYLSLDFRNKSFVEKFVEMNEKMFFYNSAITADHPFKSKWFEWPFNKKAIFYWNKNQFLFIQEIWLLGNPIVWLSAIFAVVLGSILVLIKICSKKPKDLSVFLTTFLILGWLVNFLPYSMISRPLFLYSYFPALVFSIILFGYLFFYFLNKIKGRNLKKIITVSLLVTIIAGFLVISPVTYGTANLINSLSYKMIIVHILR